MIRPCARSRNLLQNLHSKTHLPGFASPSSDKLSGGNGRFRSFYLLNIDRLHSCSSCNWISKIQPRHVLRDPPIRTSSACSTSQDLLVKKCTPCNSNMQPMEDQTAKELLKKVQDWRLLHEDGIMKLQRSWKVKSFTKGIEFFQLVADIAEAEGHHPDLHLVGWNNVKIEIWTHSAGGLTENDFILAAKINSLKMHHLLKTKTAAWAV